jgi:hypothetical protein
MEIRASVGVAPPINAFEYDWTPDRMALEYPDYKVADIGRLFFIYDYKFSGEHRVRLVFDGSRQSPGRVNPHLPRVFY